MTKYFAYVRVSTRDQAIRETFANQENSIKAYVKVHPDIEIVEWFNDLGISGAKQKERKAFMEMLDRLEEVDGIIAYDISRLSRDIKAWSFIMFELRDQKKKLILTKNDRIDDYASEKTKILTSFVEGYVADDERENTIKRIKEGIKRYKDNHSGRWGRKAPEIKWDRFEHYRNDFKPSMPITLICQMPDISNKGPVSRSYLYDAIKERNKQTESGSSPRQP